MAAQNTETSSTYRDLSSLFDSHDEVRHIAFLKVHKAASSTVQNILFRFGWERNLTFVLPPVKNPSGYPNIISLHEPMSSKNILEAPAGREYDILCNHVYYSYESFVDIMPKDTVFVAIVREPFELFKSVLNYFRPVYIYKKIHGPSPVSTFLKDPLKYEPKGRISNSWTNNRMAQEFGFPAILFKDYNEAMVQKYLKRLDREFQIVLLAELMDESCVIMKRKLNWQTQDILYISQNIASKKNFSILPDFDEMEPYKRYAKIDYAIYRHFYLRLRHEIRHEGADFDRELLMFIEIRHKVTDHCKNDNSKTLYIPGNPWGKPFYVTKTMCDNMMRGEMKFVDIIRERQYGKNKTNWSKTLTLYLICRFRQF